MFSSSIFAFKYLYIISIVLLYSSLKEKHKIEVSEAFRIICIIYYTNNLPTNQQISTGSFSLNIFS